MEPLRTLVFAGLRKDKGTFIGLALLLFLAALALTLTTSLFVDLSEREEALLDEVGSGDVCASDLASNLTDEAIEEIRALPDVESVKVTSAFSAPTRFEDAQGNELKEDVAALTTIYEAWGSSIDTHVFKDDLSSYRDVQQGPGLGEVYVRPAQKTLFGAEVGDYAVLDIGGKEERLRVAGFFEDPQLGSPFIETNHLILSEATFKELLAKVEAAEASSTSVGNIALMGNVAYLITEINVFLTPQAREAGLDGRDLAREIAEETEWGAWGSNIFSRQALVGYNLMVVQVTTAMLAAFSLLLFVVALILCLHTASSSIESGYADWGALKSIGLSRKTLRRSLTMQYVLCAFVGLLLGFVAGRLIEPLFWPPFLLLTGILVESAASPMAALGCCAALLIALLAFIALKALKIGRISPLVALRQGDGDVRFSPRGASAISGQHLKASLAWRAIVSEKGRYVGLGVCSLLLCAFIALCFGIGGAVAQDESVYRTFGMWKSDMSVRIVSDDVSFDEVRETIEEVVPVEREWQEGVVVMSFKGEARSFVGLSDAGVIDEAAILSGRSPKQANEALLGMSITRSMGLSVGDEFVVPTGEDEKTFIVSGVFSSALNGGNGIILTYEGLKELAGSDLEAAGQSRQYHVADPSKIGEATEALESRFGDAVDTELTGLFGSATNTILLVRNLLTGMGYAMSAFALVLACVAVMLVCRRMLVTERRDLGIYRAIGFSVRSLRASFATRFLAVSAIGALLGSLLVMATGGWLVGSLFALFGVGAFELSLPLWEAAIISAVFALAFTLAAYAFSGGIKNASVHGLVAE